MWFRMGLPLQAQAKVKLSGCASDWMEVHKGVPQGSILGPIFFNIFMNDIYATITRSSLYNYADDNTIAVICDTKQDVVDALSQESEVAVDWFQVNMMEANPTKFQAIILRNVDHSTHIPIRDNVVPSAKQVKLLGVTIDNRLDFHQHVSIICRRTGAQLRILQRLSSDETSRMSIFRCFVLSNFNYCSLVWNFCGAEYTSTIERIQFRALKFVYNDFNPSYTELLARANLPTLQLPRKREIPVEVFKSVNKMSPYFMWDLFKVKDITYNLRSNRNVCLNHCRTKRYGLDSLSYHGAPLWNLLPNDMKKCKDLDIF